MEFIYEIRIDQIVVAAILIVTAVIIWFYTEETAETKDEIVRQTNLQQMPVVVLYIRDIQHLKNYDKKYDEYQLKYKDFFILVNSDTNPNKFYYLALRNTGNGTAFNIEISSDSLKVKKYGNRFLAPLKDEQPFSIGRKDNQGIKDWNELKNCTFDISCNDIKDTQYVFKYRIIDIKAGRVDFIEQN